MEGGLSTRLELEKGKMFLTRGPWKKGIGSDADKRPRAASCRSRCAASKKNGTLTRRSPRKGKGMLPCEGGKSRTRRMTILLNRWRLGTTPLRGKKGRNSVEKLSSSQLQARDYDRRESTLESVDHAGGGKPVLEDPGCPQESRCRKGVLGERDLDEERPSQRGL